MFPGSSTLFRSCFGLAGAATVAVASTSAQAAYTTIGSPYPGEASHQEILEHLYGGTFIEAGESFTNGTVFAERIDDSLDQIIAAGNYEVLQAVAVFAAFEQAFGFLPGTSGGSFNEIMTVTGYGFDVVGSAAIPVNQEGDFRWARSGNGTTQSSQDSDNVGGRDHLITYRITMISDLVPSAVTNQQVTTAYLLFFEHLFQNQHLADFDYNDLVVLVTPEPASAALLALGGTLALARRRRA